MAVGGFLFGGFIRLSKGILYHRPRDARTAHLTRGEGKAVLHIVLGMTLKGRAPAPPYDAFSIDGAR